MSEAIPSIMAQSWPWGRQIAVKKIEVDTAQETASVFSMSDLILVNVKTKLHTDMRTPN